MNIAEKLEVLINYNSDIHSSANFEKEYQDIFADEGERKSQYIINDLIRQSKSEKIPLKGFVYLCIGGADGSESESILKHTDIRHSILIEFSDSASDNAKNRAANLARSGKYLYVFTGDANQKLDNAIIKLNDLKENEDISGLILSTQAVLHELPMRSPGFNLPIFIGKCFSVFSNNAFYACEPISPKGWPDLVEISLSGVNGKRLKIFSDIVNEKLKISKDKPVLVGSDHVSLRNELALEVLHKLLRCETVQQFKHEVEERLTWIDPSVLQGIIEKDLGRGSSTIEVFTTDGFEKAWRKYGVNARTPENVHLSIPSTHARIKAFSIKCNSQNNESCVHSEDIESIGADEDRMELISKHLVDVRKLSEEFNVARKDTATRSRRRAIQSILAKLEVAIKDVITYSSRELHVRLWREILLDARNLKDFLLAAENTKKSFDELFKCTMTESQEFNAIELFAEWAIDFSQTAGTSIDLNKIVSQLNKAIKFLSKQIDIVMPKQKECAIFCVRSKCKRAMASLLQRRGHRGTKAKKEINKHKSMALQDAERGHNALQINSSKFELALCLFANTATVNSEKARRGMVLLEEAFASGQLLLAGYELVRQLRMRHQYDEAINIFKSIAEEDKDVRRFHSNITYFSAAVIGLYYETGRSDTVKQNALIACQWLEEVISYEHHKAREIVDYCFVKLICGFPVEVSIKPLENLKPSSEMVWSELADIAVKLSKGDSSLSDALLLGLDDAYIWSRIGTLYSDFTNDFGIAIGFYERASMIDHKNPIFHYNKSRTLAYKMKDYKSAKLSFDYAVSLRDNNIGWYVCNEKEFSELSTEIVNNFGLNNQ